MAAEESKAAKKVPVLPWMRAPVDIDIVDECPLDLLPCLDPRLEEALKKMEFESLFKVQVAVWHETIGPGAFERDICVNSPTGTGKTLAYALPIVQKLSTRKIKCLRALVVLPTRDLAAQVKKVFDDLAPAVGLHVGLAVGQSSIADEISQLVKRPKLGMAASFDPEDLQMEIQTNVDILVATPGRLMDHINTTNGFSLEHLCYLVVDETDRLLREAYQSWLPTVIKLSASNDQAIFANEKIATSIVGSLCTLRRHGVERGFKGKTYPRLAKIILSATLTQDPSKLSQFDLHHPLLLTSGHERYKLPEGLKSYIVIYEPKLKSSYLISLLQELRGEKCIVFVSSKKPPRKLNSLLESLVDLPFKICGYSSLQHQSVRRKTLKAFIEGKIDVLVASDVLARGIDVVGVRNVINYDKPAHTKTYIHRAGRTARAGHAGCCFTLLRKEEVRRFKKILQKADNHSFDMHTVPADSIGSLRSTCSSAQ